ncbi:TAXI family TRAP transporter solute-binding subunit [Natronolimnohabitans innermongolicus]|uniref:TRAP transporter solute receptor, TAXI family protein n=1 Tax=Natronolimnohabitans innermongolicus JCM 12255 TaxID=1227499 RepID=L9WX72_9EURY|nr:TAXI family TRAP transporter solute-binding subunit [Natronolimnohabitans innermongolicus]ELY54050.1 TRAP transporter solute receptor, TAXI family protein [Natronolimnohabitans innermongolicus JCM 12255]
MGKHINRRRVIAIAGSAGVVSVAGCIGEDAEEGPDEEDNGDLEEAEPEEGGEVLALHAGGTEGTYYPLGGDMKSIVEAHTPHGIQVQSTGASVENAASLGREEAELALIQNDIAYFAHNGVELEEFEDQPQENIRGIASLYPETIHMVTQEDSDIESVEDLEGASVNTGDLGSGTQVNALQILESAGIDDFSESNTDFGTAADQIADGDVDAAITVGGYPLGAIEDLATTQDISFVEVDGDVREQLLEDAEWLAEDTIPGGTYDGVEDDVETISVQAMLATYEAMDEAVIEEVTAAMFDNVDDFTTQSEYIDLETAQEAMPIDLHAGAQAYFDDVDEAEPDEDEDEDAENGDEDDEDMENGDEDAENGEDEENGDADDE